MKFPLIEFEGFPIEYKKLYPSDFKEFDVKEDKRFMLNPNEKGYVTDELVETIDINESNTTIINCGTNQGKTTALLKIIQNILANPDLKVVIAVPFLTLIDQYESDIVKIGIKKELIFKCDSEGIDEMKNSIDKFQSKRIYIITVNNLLGNPGYDNLTSSKDRKKFTHETIKSCTKESKKVIFIYDEIHDAIHNFKQDTIHVLWKWKDVIHKNIVLSATFNESSKIVLKYLAELTSKKIHLIESPRIKIDEKQGDLHLHYDSYYDDLLISVIEKAFREKKEIDILCYSKSYSKTICDTGTRIGKIIKAKVPKVNLCVSEENTTTKYDDSMFNVGTNFKSGINILKENHCYIIILPRSGDKRGIFTNGVNSVLQAVARQRLKGEIHFIMNYPARFNYNSLKFEDSQIAAFTSIYDRLVDPFKSYRVVHYDYDTQNSLLREFYKSEIVGYVESEIKHIRSIERSDLPELRFPSCDSFILNSGDSYLANYYPFFGYDLSAYVTYIALSNQFTNCTLKSMNFKPNLNFIEGKIFPQLNELYTELKEKESPILDITVINDSLLFEKMTKHLFTNYNVSYTTKKSKSEVKKITKSQYNVIEKYLLKFILAKRYDDTVLGKKEPLELKEIFLSGISIAEAEQALSFEISIDYTKYDRDLLDAYIHLGKLYRLMIKNISSTTYNKEEIKFIPNKPFPMFINTPADEEEMLKTINTLCIKDPILSKNLIAFRENLNKTSDTNKKKEIFYTYLKQAFFKLSEKEAKVNNPYGSDKLYIRPIVQIFDIPAYNTSFNLIEKSNSIKTDFYADYTILTDTTL